MKQLKRKAARIVDLPVKKQVLKSHKREIHLVKSYKDSYAGTERELLNEVVQVIVKIIKKEVGL